MDSSESGVLSGYNARSATWEQVASSFEPPALYWQLTDSQNQSIIGPRGIGKTTLLKMLCGPALDAWNDDGSGDADRARKAIAFTGVFVPANKMWAGQVSSLTSAVDSVAAARFGLAAFTYMALKALIEAAQYRSENAGHGQVDLSPEGEANIARRSAVVFGAPRATASLRALKHSVAENLGALGQLLRRAANPALTEDERHEILTSRVLDIDFYSSAPLFVDLFNDAAGEPEGAWVFLLDELEFLPVATREEIDHALRGQDPRLRFKVSLAPWHDREGDKPMPFNDFTPVDLTPRHRERDDEFAQRLFAREMRAHGRAGTADEILGPGGFETVDQGKGSYLPDGENGKAFAQLAELNGTFRSWVEERGLNPFDLSQMSVAQYGQVRKAGPLVRLRLEYLRETETGDVVARSRKRAPDIYAGAESIWAMSEANPRWLKAFAHELFTHYRDGGRVPPNIQVEAAMRVADNYLGYFRTLDPSDQTEPSTGQIAPYDLLTRLGDSFRREVHEANFTADPVTMARFEAAVGDPAEHVVKMLVFLGGLVRQDDEKGTRVRLTHMFAPRYRLPLRNGRSKLLSSLLEAAPPQQLSLTDDPLDD